jgi:hypothetical protein
MMRKAELFDQFQTNNTVKMATKDTVINEVANTQKIKTVTEKREVAC